MTKMKRVSLLLIVFLLLFTVTACGKKDEELKPIEGEITERAEAFVTKLSEGDFKGAVAFFDSNMKNAIPESELSKTWKQLQDQVGEYESQVGIREEKIQEYDVIFVTTQFKQALIDIRVVFNSDKQIAGLFFEPAKDATTESYNPPSYGQPANFTEQEITVGEGEWALPGTLTLPKGNGPFRAVILVHGSGPNDRDETLGPNKPFKDLTMGLANQGIAVLRYDKRTLVHGQKFTSLQNEITVHEETVEDAQLAVELLKSIKNIDPSKIYVLGHSLGGTLAPRIAEGKENIAGLVILAGAARPLEDLILMQIKYIAEADGSISEEEETQIKLIQTHIENIKNPNLTANTPSSELLGVPAPYWLDLRNYDPVQMAETLSIPMLILQGQRDYQVTMEDFEIWKEKLGAMANVKFASYPNLNHLFMEGEGPSVPSEYERSGNVSKAVVDDIVSWLKNQ